MKITKFPNLLCLLGLSAIYFSEFVVCFKSCKRSIAMHGMIMPRRSCLMDLTTFQSQVTDIIWRPFYFGSARPEETTFFQGEYKFSFPNNNRTLVIEFSGALPNGTCVDEANLPGIEGGIPPYSVISKKAEFLGDSYTGFLKSDPADRYLIHVECLVDRPVKRCPVDKFWVNLFVRDPRPDSVPLHRALKILRQATCLTLDFLFEGFRFIYVFGENECPAP